MAVEYRKDRKRWGYRVCLAGKRYKKYAWATKSEAKDAVTAAKALVALLETVLPMGEKELDAKVPKGKADTFTFPPGSVIRTEAVSRWDLGWVYTVIAGVLNILVIYDAFAGPAFAEGERAQRAAQEAAPA